jgi:succinate-acetate transporter protein
MLTRSHTVGWRGAGGFASATNACSIWFGGLLLLIAGLLEFILGNDFSFLVFMGYGAHILTFATTFVPSFNAVAFYSDGDPNKATAGFAVSFGTKLTSQNLPPTEAIDRSLTSSCTQATTPSP